MLKKKAPPRIGRGGKVTVVTDRTPEELKHVVYQMRYRNMTAASLAEMLGVTPAIVSNWVHGVTSVKRMHVYAIKHVLTHSYWDDESNKWVVID